LQLLGSEVAAARPAGAAVVRRLSELIFVHAIRSAAQGGAALPRGWLSGLSDPELARALGAMHAQPAAPWTVESLARRARVSRSVFAARFRAAVGEPPLAYLTRWRMHVAWQRLRDQPESSTNAIAQSVGYESAAAFHRAFLRLTGVRPGEVRGHAEAHAASA
jgi:transcriptional regulator GlxA family with amidase domain